MNKNKICPKCKGNNIILVVQARTDAYKCQSCGFVGNMIEKKIIGREFREDLDLFGGKK